MADEQQTVETAFTSGNKAAEPTRALLRRQIARLERVVQYGPSDRAAMALRLAKGMRARLRDLNTAPLGWRQIAGEIGENGGTYSSFAVDDVCRGACMDGVVLTGVERVEISGLDRRAA